MFPVSSSGGVGVAALAGGVVFGILTITTNSAAKDKCSRSTNTGADPNDFDPTTGHCFTDSPSWSESNRKRDDARTFANLANVLVPVGALGLGAGLYLFLRSTRVVERPASGPSARLVPSLGGASMEGTF